MTLVSSGVIIALLLSLFCSWPVSAQEKDSDWITPREREIRTEETLNKRWLDLQSGKEGRLFFSIGGDVGYLSGHTLYHINIPDNTPVDGFMITEWESELEFPLDSPIGELTASLGKKGTWAIDLSLSKNLSEDTGKMKDYDWMTVQEFSTRETYKFLIIYSESDTEMDLLFFNINGRYYFWKFHSPLPYPSNVVSNTIPLLKRNVSSLGLIAGYRYENLSFDIKNLKQTDISSIYPIFIPGKVLAYEITYNIPYGGIAFDFMPSDRFSLNFMGAFGWAFSEDEDDHILRFKRSTSDADGPFYLLKGEGNLSLIQGLSLLLSLEYLMIDTDGTQSQTWYETTYEAPKGYTISDIDYNAESEQLSFGVGLRYTF